MASVTLPVTIVSCAQAITGAMQSRNKQRTMALIGLFFRSIPTSLIYYKIIDLTKVSHLGFQWSVETCICSFSPKKRGEVFNMYRSNTAFVLAKYSLNRILNEYSPSGSSVTIATASIS